MKAVTGRMFISLVGLALVVPFFALALIVAAHVVSLAEGVHDDVLLIALAFGGAVFSIVNGFGRRASKAERPARVSVNARERQSSGGASMINLGY